MKKQTSQAMTAEDVWHYNWRWILLGGNKDPDFVSKDDIELMKAIIKDAKVELYCGFEPARSLHKTVEPVSP
tara:strand:- start:1096 stop:1311 length:216 start_codon:yes stop_codon:yes gene_type:complete